MNRLIADFINLFYPKLCNICDKILNEGEEIVCFSCLSELPLTNYTNLKHNEIEKSFFGRVEIEEATALFFYFKKGNTQKLIHQLKYKGKQEIGYFTGNWLGDELVNSDRFGQIDCVIPVPLHKNRLKERGYNQVTNFGLSLTEKLNTNFIENVLVRISVTNSQTKKNRFDRSKNIEEKFDLINCQLIEGKHILLIDDVITTGATLESCCIQLAKAKNVKISIATIAFTL